MEDKQLRILVSGDVCGEYDVMFQRVRSVMKKNGDFNILLCVGSFFGDSEASREVWREYKEGRRAVPLPTYILGPNDASTVDLFPLADGTDGEEVAPGITYLGHHGVLRTPTGLVVAYLSGHETRNGKAEAWQHTAAHGNALREMGSKEMDILLSSTWPEGVCKYSPEPVSLHRTAESSVVANVCRYLQPRYHFAGLQGFFHERVPFRNHEVLRERPKPVTRFIGLAGATAKKGRWLYAFSMTPWSRSPAVDLNKQPPDVTENPWNLSKVAKATLDCGEETHEALQFFFDLGNRGKERGHQARGHRRGQGERRSVMDEGLPLVPSKHQRTTGFSPAVTPDSCWFCLASPNVEKHLVVSIAEHMYMALAKGPLTPEHMLLSPISHHPSSPTLPPPALAEAHKFIRSLKLFHESRGARAVVFERNYRSVHLQLQVVGVPSRCSTEDIKEAFEKDAKFRGLDLQEIPESSDLSQVVPVGAPYFYVELDSGQKLLHRIRNKFPLHFGREVLAHKCLLNVTERSDWRACQDGRETEEMQAAAFRKMFSPFDFTLTN
uniref:CWF19-like protein 1 isoform X1 n=1 Tax=Myxine glutinosa TaxID=7769 RepID=UPI00358E978E